MRFSQGGWRAFKRYDAAWGWAVSEFGFSIREVSIYFSIPAMAFLFISPFGGMVVDKVDRKKLFYTRLCCATLHTHFALSLFVKLSLAIFIPVAPP